MFGTRLPASRFFIRHAKGITLSNVSLTLPDDEARPSFVMDHAKDVELKNIRVNGRELRDEEKMVAKIASEAVSVTE